MISHCIIVDCMLLRSVAFVMIVLLAFLSLTMLVRLITVSSHKLKAQVVQSCQCEGLESQGHSLFGTQKALRNVKAPGSGPCLSRLRFSERRTAPSRRAPPRLPPRVSPGGVVPLALAPAEGVARGEAEGIHGGLAGRPLRSDPPGSGFWLNPPDESMRPIPPPRLSLLRSTWG